MRGSKYETSDAVFGVKESLIVDITRVADEEDWPDKYGVGSNTALLKLDFVLLTEEENSLLREKKATDETERQGGLRVENALLVQK